jgi:hypothetical protein
VSPRTARIKGFPAGRLGRSHACDAHNRVDQHPSAPVLHTASRASGDLIDLACLSDRLLGQGRKFNRKAGYVPRGFGSPLSLRKFQAIGVGFLSHSACYTGRAKHLANSDIEGLA